MPTKSHLYKKDTLSMEDDDNIYDEIDRFNMEKDNLRDVNHRVKRKHPVEVLSVNVDESEEEEESDSEQESVTHDDFEKSTFFMLSLILALPSKDKWGKKRHAFYGSYADADYGGINDSEEEEILELEEEDAIARQKKADAAISAIDYDALDHDLERSDDDEADKPLNNSFQDNDNFLRMSESDKLEYFKKTCPEAEQNIKEYQDRTAFFELISTKLLDASTKLSYNDQLKDRIRSAVAIYAGYLNTLIFYLRLKCSCQLKDLIETEDHPVVTTLNKYQKLLKSVDEFSTKVFDKISRDPGWLQRIDKPTSKPEKHRLAPQIEEVEYNGLDEMKESYEEDDESEFGKRGVTYEMAKNLGSDAKRKRSKDLRHSRVRKRKQFDKALIRRRSQIPDVKRELTKYDGEKRGIKANTVRSIKLKA